MTLNILTSETSDNLKYKTNCSQCKMQLSFKFLFKPWDYGTCLGIVVNINYAV